MGQKVAKTERGPGGGAGYRGRGSGLGWNDVASGLHQEGGVSPVCVLWREGRGLSYHVAREVHEELGSVTQDETQLLEYGVGHELLVGVVGMAQNNGELL